MKLFTATISLSFLAVSASVGATTVRFYGARACNGNVIAEYRNVRCNTCVDPPGDFYGVRVTENGSNQRVTSHNQNSCTPASQVGQWYGNLCNVAGNTAIRSFWIACAGQRTADAGTEFITDSGVEGIEATDTEAAGKGEVQVVENSA